MEDWERYNMSSYSGLPASTATTATIRPGAVGEPSSPEDDTNLKKEYSFDMELLMGDAVGNMSISPDSRDLVLSARKGLVIIDLDDTARVPQLLPQGGTWEVADVQWNPHLSHSQYIVSTSSEKLLIWNLALGGLGQSTCIEHVLRSHYRAITDINWHTIEPDVVISTGIDSWQWAWDLRVIQKPIMGLCAFGPPGTQVKWNRLDGNILASSHANQILIWDRRKGSLPLQCIKAHDAKIYGIDWAHDRRNELVTCSLDKTIKVWDTQTAQPNVVINTSYPVWRARDLPFGQGVLSLPQRGNTVLEMYAYEDTTTPIETFPGHEDVVREFVWRRGGEDHSDFQLITWSRDKTLRFWPVNTEVIQRAGTTPTRTLPFAPSRRDSKIPSSHSSGENDHPPTLSAPIGNRGILASVRAVPPQRPVQITHKEGQAQRKPIDLFSQSASGPPRRSKPIAVPTLATSVKDIGHPGTMTRGSVAGARPPISQQTWLSSRSSTTKAGTARDGSSGGGSGSASGDVSRVGSRSRPPSIVNHALSRAFSSTRERSISLDRNDEQGSDQPLDLQEEITSVMNKINSAKLKLEKADFKKRICTFGLQGPWGDSTSVFLRITFTIPRDYPLAKYPDGVPKVDLERSPLISVKQRAFMLRRLQHYRETERPCLEKCLKFLLLGDQQEDSGHRAAMDSESSSEDEALDTRRGEHGSSALKADKNLAEPRTSQGVFGVNGELVCFFRAPPRIVRNPLREISLSPSINSRPSDAALRPFQSPALLSDAVKRLSSAAQDREPRSMERKRGDERSGSNNVVRIMDNLFTFPHPAHRHPAAIPKARRVSNNSQQVEDDYALLSTRRSSVFIKSTEGILGIPDPDAAVRYVMSGHDFADICKTNIAVARLLGRSDHERVFRTLHVLARKSDPDQSRPYGGVDQLLAALTTRLYEQLLAEKDIQMLVYVSILLLISFPQESSRSRRREISSSSPSPGPAVPSRGISMEYFDPSRSSRRHGSPFSPPISNPPTPTHTPGGHMVAMNSPSSKGSWSSILMTTSMKQLIPGVRPTSGTTHESGKQSGSVGNRRSILRRDPARPSSNSPITKSSWETNDSLEGSVLPVSIRRRPTFSTVVRSGKSVISQKGQITFCPSVEEQFPSSFLTARMRGQFICHILAYAEMLLAWQLPEKRCEMLKLVGDDIRDVVEETDVADEVLYAAPIGYLRPCEHCGHPGKPGITMCYECNGRLPARCSICRLSIKGLSHVCPTCLHVSHLKCWRVREDSACATGCGCLCALPVYKSLFNGMVMVSPIIPVTGI